MYTVGTSMYMQVPFCYKFLSVVSPSNASFQFRAKLILTVLTPIFTHDLTLNYVAMLLVFVNEMLLIFIYRVGTVFITF